jgi:hypothetical protein
MLSNKNKATMEAFKRGYRVMPEGCVRSPTGAIRRLCMQNCNGYKKFSFNITIRGKATAIYVHKLAAYQKFGDTVFASDIEVRHLNNVSTDNSLANIGIGTHKQNMHDIPQNLRKQYSSKGSVAGAKKLRKFNDEQIVLIRKMHISGMSYNKLCKIFKCAKSTISYIITGKTYKAS